MCRLCLDVTWQVSIFLPSSLQDTLKANWEFLFGTGSYQLGHYKTHKKDVYWTLVFGIGKFYFSCPLHELEDEEHRAASLLTRRCSSVFWVQRRGLIWEGCRPSYQEAHCSWVQTAYGSLTLWAEMLPPSESSVSKKKKGRQACWEMKRWLQYPLEKRLSYFEAIWTE